MKSITVFLIAVFGMLWLSAAQAAEEKNLPLPEVTVARTRVAPVIDGVIAPGEWDAAPAVTGFVKAFSNELAKVQSVAWCTYDAQYLYVCLKNYRAANITLLSKRGRSNDDDNIVFDQSNEIWITPPVLPAATYQTLFNAYPGVFDVKFIPSVGYTAKSWKGNWEFACKEARDNWIVEARAPLTSFGFTNITDGAVWKALFTTDNFADGDAFRAWAPGGAFADIPRHGFVTFKENTPVFQLLDIESIFTGKPSFPMAVTGAATGASRVTATVRFGAAIAARDDDVVLTKMVDVAPGKRDAFTLAADLGAMKGGYCEVTAKSADAVLYHQIFPFVVNGFTRTPPTEIKTTPYETPFGLNAFYAPLNKKLIVKIDRLYMSGRADVVGGTARLRDAAGAVVAERPIAPFDCDYSQFPMDLAKLTVPVQTEEDWKAAQPVIDANKKIAAENTKRKKDGLAELPLQDVPGPQQAAYTLQVTLKTKDGAEIAATEIPVKLMGYQFEWLGSNVGISDKVIPPWTPLAWKNGALSMWNKTYRLNGLGLADSIVNAGAPQLSGAMKLLATVDGKDIEVKAGAPRVTKQTEAAMEFTGTAQFGGLQLANTTRAEFDGFVLNTLTLTPRTPTKIDRLSLVVTMPKSEAPCFVTTAGGWSATHGFTPAKWDSRETSSGSITGNFVPYIFLTDSDRGFCWFSDSMKGWVLDPAAPTQELLTTPDTVTLRINFVTRAGTLTAPTTLTYGWMVTPQKPQPKEWRAYVINYALPYPQAHGVFWTEADWAVLWPYYCSPYPWDYEKSKAILSGKNNAVRGSVGNIAHAIARYRDAKGRMFPEVAADWGMNLGSTGDGNVARSRGPNDFQVWHFDQWVKRSGLKGLYFDENYLSEDFNYLTGGAFLLPDERIQPGYNYLGLREYDKRLRYMFHDNGVEPPYLWLHTTSGQPVYAWQPDVAMEGENVEPSGKYDDYMDGQSAGRLRSIGMGRNLGAVPTVMCQSAGHWNPTYSPFLVHQFVGWLAAHDCVPATVPLWWTLAPEMEIWRDDITFLPYWKTGLGITSKTPDVVVSAHTRPGQTVLWIANTAKEDRTAVVVIDLKKLGLDAAKTLAFDTETGGTYTLTNGTLTLPIPARLWRSVRLMQAKELAGNVTFIAHFEKDAVADEALGYRWPQVRTLADVPQATMPGKAGNGASLNAALTYLTRQHVTREHGAVAWQLNCDPALTSGTLFAVGKLQCTLNKGKVQLALDRAVFAQGTLALPAGWHTIAVRWQEKSITVTCDDAPLLTAVLQDAMPINPTGRGLEIADCQGKIKPSTISFGPLKDAVIDDLTMTRN